MGNQLHVAYKRVPHAENHISRLALVPIDLMLVPMIGVKDGRPLRAKRSSHAVDRPVSGEVLNHRISHIVNTNRELEPAAE